MCLECKLLPRRASMDDSRFRHVALPLMERYTESLPVIEYEGDAPGLTYADVFDLVRSGVNYVTIPRRAS